MRRFLLVGRILGVILAGGDPFGVPSKERPVYAAALAFLGMTWGCRAPEGRVPEAGGQVQLDSIASFGDADLFGSVDDVLITDTDVDVLDEFSKSAHRFGRDGSMKVGLTREGEGPGELLFPEGLAVTPSGDLVVLDPGTGGLNLFRIFGDSLEFLRRIPVPFIGDDVCS